ncbi:MAG: potassium transporter TrkG [Nitrososphaeraceae archaeon]|nr:potassium transporter TrkG [Nitrososphaeraceae archaeon]MDW0333415.1 potassium transporter TrkG [Nitrososphaeraceae archaeon]
MHRLFVILDENMSVASAVKQMHSHNAGTIIVLRGNTPVGIVTDSDIINKVVMKGEDSDEVFLKSIMSAPLVTISPKGTVKQALQLMRLNQIKRIPIADSFGILGVVTQEALANAVRTSVIERTFSRYRSLIREQYKPILGNLGIVLQFSAILLVVPAFLGTALGESASIVGIFFAVVGLSFAGFFLTNIGEKGPMNLKQASIFIVASFLLLSLFGSIPYIYINPFGNDTNTYALFVNSFFESASGFTTTGLSIISSPENLPKSLDFYRSYTNWVGGLSFVYLVMILFFPERKLSAMKSVFGGGLLRVRELLITIVGIFTAYTLILIFMLIIFSQTDVLDAISLIFSTITGGGFSPVSDIITPDHPERLAILAVGMILSALPFAFHYHIFSRKGLLTRRTISLEVAVFLILIVIGIMIFYWLAWGQVDIYSSIFHVISASTTSGFQYLNIQSIPYTAKIFLILLMLVGGTAFSTAGGIKVGRFIVLYEEFTKKSREKDRTAITGTSTSTSISSTANPYRSTEFVTMFPDEHRKRNLEEVFEQQARILKRVSLIMSKKVVREILLVIVLYVSIALITGSVLSSLTNSHFVDALFEAVSAISTTGLTAGITSVNLDVFSKLLLITNMIVGRFEIITIFYIFFVYFRR